MKTTQVGWRLRAEIVEELQRLADAEIANRTARSGQRRPGRSGGQRIGECSASRTEDKGGVCSIWDLTQHSPAQSRDAA